MKRIEFKTNSYTDQKFFTVSDEDYEKVKGFKWRVGKCESDKDAHLTVHYRIVRSASVKERLEGWPSTIKLHRWIFDLKGEVNKDTLIDHKNLWWQNTRKDIRLATHKENGAYCIPKIRKAEANIGLPKGVYRKNNRKMAYFASIKVNGKRIYLGGFNDPKEAQKAYAKAAKEHFKDFAKFK